MPQQGEPLAQRLQAARDGFERMLEARADGGRASAAPDAGFRHWGDTPQWYDWHKR